MAGISSFRDLNVYKGGREAARLIFEISNRSRNAPQRRLNRATLARNRRSDAWGDRRDPDFIIKARTDAIATHGLEEAIRRLNLYSEAGADLLFADALL